MIFNSNCKRGELATMVGLVGLGVVSLGIVVASLLSRTGPADLSRAEENISPTNNPPEILSPSPTCMPKPQLPHCEAVGPSGTYISCDPTPPPGGWCPDLSPTPTEVLTPTVTPTPTTSLIPGDANEDGKVDGVDYFFWLRNYGKETVNKHKDGDFDGNGRVDGFDYVIWLNRYKENSYINWKTPDVSFEAAGFYFMSGTGRKYFAKPDEGSNLTVTSQIGRASCRER